MAQNWKDTSYASSNVAVSDLTDFETNFAVLRSNFSGTSAPSAGILEPGLLWFDTNLKVMKIRNAADNGWQGLMYGDVDTKIWVYLNSAPDGWVQDSTPTDKVVAVKGGATYVTGGADAGSWTMSGMSSNPNTHNHQWYQFTNPYGYGWDDIGNLISYLSPLAHAGGLISTSKGDPARLSESLWVQNTSHSHSSETYSTTFRPAAAVGILVYPNI